MQITYKIPETGEKRVLGDIRSIVNTMALWSTYPPGFCVLIVANAVPSALALSQRRLFFVRVPGVMAAQFRLCTSF
jgi:hypothetical protein